MDAESVGVVVLGCSNLFASFFLFFFKQGAKPICPISGVGDPPPVPVKLENYREDLKPCGMLPPFLNPIICTVSPGCQKKTQG